MPAIITNKFRLNNAEQFSESFSEAANNKYYLGIGRPQPYGTLTRPDGRTDYEGTDALPITPADSIGREFYTYDDLVAAKIITGSNVSFVIPRRNWTAGTIYDIYRHDYGEYTTGSTSVRKTSNSGATTLFDSNFSALINPPALTFKLTSFETPVSLSFAPELTFAFKLLTLILAEIFDPSFAFILIWFVFIVFLLVTTDPWYADINSRFLL